MNDAKRKGPWSAARIATFLEGFQEPLRVACNGGSGHPVLASLWFVPIEGRLWLATQHTASVATHLERDPRCAFEASVVTPPYCGVRGQGVATLHRDRGEEILRKLIGRYLEDQRSPLAALLLERVESEVAIEVRPSSIVSWDYRERMEGSV